MSSDGQKRLVIGQRITENNATNADRDANRLLERIVSP